VAGRAGAGRALLGTVLCTGHAACGVRGPGWRGGALHRRICGGSIVPSRSLCTSVRKFSPAITAR
jgi:hypothetical protein